MMKPTRSTQNLSSTRSLTKNQLRDVRGGQKVVSTANDGGVTASDDWEARI